MNEQYLLAKPIEVEALAESHGYERDLYRVPEFKGYRSVTGSRDFAVFEKQNFNSLFVPLSVREQQIREALEPLLCYWQQVDPYTSEYEGEELLDECVAAILGIEREQK